MHPGSGTAPAASGVRNKESFMRRSSSRQLGLLAAAVLTLAACSPKDAPPPPGPPADALEGALDIVAWPGYRSEEHTSELQSRQYLVCRLLLEKKKKNRNLQC